MRMLPGFRSRCKMPRWCAWWTARATVASSSAACRSDRSGGRLAGLLRAAAGAVRVVGQAQLAGLAVEAVVVGEEGAQAVGQVGVAGQQGFAVGDGAGLDLLQVGGEDRVERIGMGTGRLVGGTHGF